MTQHYRTRYTPEAAQRIRKLHPQIKHEIRDAIRSLVKSPLSGHTLQHELTGFRSYRIRSYRIIYRLNDHSRTLDVIFVGQRRNVYEELRELVNVWKQIESDEI